MWSSALQSPQAEVGHQFGAELELSACVVHEPEADELRQVRSFVVAARSSI